MMRYRWSVLIAMITLWAVITVGQDNNVYQPLHSPLHVPNFANRSPDEDKAIKALRFLYVNEYTYRDGLGKGAFAPVAELFRQDFINAELANACGVPATTSIGKVQCPGTGVPYYGYIFKLRLLPKRSGNASAFSIKALVANQSTNTTQNRNFFVDETGVIRFTRNAGESPTKALPAVNY